MTIKELIAQLSELDQELHVFTSGYEGGFNYVEISQEEEFCLDVYVEGYYGPHEYILSMSNQDPADYKQVKGIVL
jgi:hypothetical protein